MRLKHFLLSLFPIYAVLTGSFGVPAHAQNREAPYWATLRYDKVNMRVGPSGEYKIDWVYRRKGMPIKVVRVRESWRLVEDPEGTRGWIDQTQLHPARGVVVTGEGLADMRESADTQSKLNWRAEPGVIGRLGECEDDYCEIDVAGRTGWVRADRLWGVGEP